MTVMNSWCERLFLISLVTGISIVLADFKFFILPIHGLWLLLYICFVIVITIWITVFNIQKLLQKSVPFEYNIGSYESFQKVYKVLHNNLFIVHNKLKPKSEVSIAENKVKRDKSIDERIELLVYDIEQRFISKWYKLISNEETFSAESKILVEGIIRRVLQVSVQIDSSKLICGILVILLKHLKEYRKAIKRLQKSGGSIENTYRYSHIASKNEAALEHYIHKLTANLLREFISWELYNSLPCRLLISVLSKKLTTYFIFYISQPGWLNYRIFYQSASESDKIKYKLDKYLYISLSDIDLSDNLPKNDDTTTANEKVIAKNEKRDSCTPESSPKKDVTLLPVQDTNSKIAKSDSNISKINTEIQNDSEFVIEKALTKMISQQTAPILQRAEKSFVAETISENCEASSQPKRSEPVKIHSPKSSTKHWNEAELSDLSVGQDLLALDALNSSELQGFSGRRLWGYNADLIDELEKPIVVWEGPEITKEKETDESKTKPGNVTASTLHNMRELQQSTVNATEKAIHKIGDLQDEAVGVVEGIFDFGMAGIRKGLRLTGLQEHIVHEASKQSPKIHQEAQKIGQEAPTQSPKNPPKLVKLGHVNSNSTIDESKKDNADNVWMNPLAKEESPNGFENQILLEKSPNLSDDQLPEIANLYLTDSPEYEETADLASTISKLRSLLQQKSSESSLNTPAVSPMLLEDKSCTTPVEQVGEISRGDGGMQRFARTVTGMFNTFKTALPGSIAEQKANNGQWIFVENETSETDLPSLLNSLLVERRDYCTVDTAYEAMDSLDLLTESVNSQTGKIPWENQTYEDELDDLDTTIPITKALFDVICECLLDTKCALNQEPVFKAVLILTGIKLEQILNQQAEQILRSINKIIGPLPKVQNDNVMALKLEELVGVIEKSLPYPVKEIFGKEVSRIGLKFLISSLQSPKINQDIMLQIFESICSQLIFTSSQMSPTPSA